MMTNYFLILCVIFRSQAVIGQLNLYMLNLVTCVILSVSSKLLEIATSIYLFLMSGMNSSHQCNMVVCAIMHEFAYIKTIECDNVVSSIGFRIHPETL